MPYRMEKLFSDFRRSGMCRSIGAGVNINRLATALIIDGRRRNESFAVPSLFNQVERDVETLSVCYAPSLAENREEERIFLHISRAAWRGILIVGSRFETRSALMRKQRFRQRHTHTHTQWDNEMIKRMMINSCRLQQQQQRPNFLPKYVQPAI